MTYVFNYQSSCWKIRVILLSMNKLFDTPLTGWLPWLLFGTFDQKLYVQINLQPHTYHTCSSVYFFVHAIFYQIKVIDNYSTKPFWITSKIFIFKCGHYFVYKKMYTWQAYYYSDLLFKTLFRRSKYEF